MYINWLDYHSDKVEVGGSIPPMTTNCAVPSIADTDDIRNWYVEDVGSNPTGTTTQGDVAQLVSAGSLYLQGWEFKSLHRYNGSLFC